MFAPPISKTQTKAAANSTNKLPPQRSTLVARPFGSGAVEQADMLQRRIGNQAILRFLSQQARNRTANEPDGHTKQEADLESRTAREAPRGVAWDFSKIPIFPPNQQRASPPPLSPASTPRIKVETFGLGSLASEAAQSLTQRDGSPDDLAMMSDDQDALTPDIFEAGRKRRGVHIRVSGGNPAGTPDFPGGLRWVQTIDTNAPLFGQSPPYVDFVLNQRDDKPFYFAEGREHATFSDSPSRSANAVRWDATLSLTGVKGQTITRLDSVNYGFDIDASGTLSLHQPRATGTIDLVIHGDTLRSEYPDWVFSGGFAVPQAPGGAVTGGTGTA
jgi:hypothetical protein